MINLSPAKSIHRARQLLTTRRDSLAGVMAVTSGRHWSLQRVSCCGSSRCNTPAAAVTTPRQSTAAAIPAMLPGRITRFSRTRSSHGSRAATRPNRYSAFVARALISRQAGSCCKGALVPTSTNLTPSARDGARHGRGGRWPSSLRRPARRGCRRRGRAGPWSRFRPRCRSDQSSCVG